MSSDSHYPLSPIDNRLSPPRSPSALARDLVPAPLFSNSFVFPRDLPDVGFERRRNPEFQRALSSRLSPRAGKTWNNDQSPLPNPVTRSSEVPTPTGTRMQTESKTPPQSQIQPDRTNDSSPGKESNSSSSSKSVDWTHAIRDTEQCLAQISFEGSIRPSKPEKRLKAKAEAAARAEALEKARVGIDRVLKHVDALRAPFDDGKGGERRKCRLTIETEEEIAGFVAKVRVVVVEGEEGGGDAVGDGDDRRLSLSAKGEENLEEERDGSDEAGERGKGKSRARARARVRGGSYQRRDGQFGRRPHC